MECFPFRELHVQEEQELAVLWDEAQYDPDDLVALEFIAFQFPVHGWIVTARLTSFF